MALAGALCLIVRVSSSVPSPASPTKAFAGMSPDSSVWTTALRR
jgi:hypothetical protein